MLFAMVRSCPRNRNRGGPGSVSPPSPCLPSPSFFAGLVRDVLFLSYYPVQSNNLLATAHSMRGLAVLPIPAVGSIVNRRQWCRPLLLPLPATGPKPLMLDRARLWPTNRFCVNLSPSHL